MQLFNEIGNLFPVEVLMTLIFD